MRKALGRGLDALLPSAPLPVAPSLAAPAEPLKVPLAKIRPNHLQPRRFFDPEKLSELAASIKAHGLAQPLVVSPDSDGTYELIAGERRLRACELAGLKEIEVVVRKPADDRERLAIALIENLQREDLNAVETALGYLRLMKEFGINQTQLGDVVGKSKQAISNTLRILELPEEIQKALQSGQLQEGHGRALLQVKDPIKRLDIFRRALQNALSVREIEDLAHELEAPQPAQPAPRVEKPAPKVSADIRDLEDSLQQRLGTRVKIKTNGDGKKGSLVIHFFSLEDFERIVGLINK